MPDAESSYIVIGALRENLDLSDCAVMFEPDYNFYDGPVTGNFNVQGRLALSQGNQFLEVPVVFDEKTAVVTAEVDDADVETPLEEYCLTNGFQFTVRPDGVVSMIVIGDLPEITITIPLIVNGEKLDSITFEPPDLTQATTKLTLDSNTDDEGKED